MRGNDAARGKARGPATGCRLGRRRQPHRRFRNLLGRRRGQRDPQRWQDLVGRPDITISGNDQTRIFKVAGDVRP
jgi:hypothetical protein